MPARFLQRVARARHQVVRWFRPAGTWSRRRVATAAAAGVVVIGLVAGLLVGLGSAPTPKSAAKAPHYAARTTTTARAKPHHKPAKKVVKSRPGPPTCPLTGLRPPGGTVPRRELVAVKVGNNPTARPQSGLEDADIVYDTLAEGGITRYIAVFQCHDAPEVGPIRSVRWDDWHILYAFGHAALSFVGGVIPNQDQIAALKWICNLNDFVQPQLYHQDPYRVRPDATYSPTITLYSACPPSTPPPAPWPFSLQVPPGSGPVSSAEVDYSPDADVVWAYNARDDAFLHFFREGGALVPDFSASGARIWARNVLVEFVQIQYGPYAESPGSTGDVESITQGSGVAYLLRDGRVLKGRWIRTHWAYMTRFVGPGGRPFTFHPGNTWVEIVPVGDSFSLTP